VTKYEQYKICTYIEMFNWFVNSGKIKVQCPQCKNEFYTSKHDYKEGSTYCSRNCLLKSADQEQLAKP
jgi:hypothetical protein